MDSNFWITIGFVVFVIISFKSIKELVINILDSKIQQIKNKVYQSKELRNNAQQSLEYTQKKLDNIKIEEFLILENAKKIADNIIQSKLNELDFLINQKNNQVQETINYNKREAIKEIYEYFFNLSSKIAVKYINDKLEKADVDIVKTLYDSRNIHQQKYY